MPDRRNALKRYLDSLKNPAWVSFTWFGMTAGISLLATPVRFTAPTITRPVALDVGRVVFTALNTAEFVALILLLVLVRVSGRAPQLLLAVCGLALIQIAQASWLLPELAERARQVVAGVEPAASAVHGLFSASQILKLALLLFVGFRAMALARTDRKSTAEADGART